MLGLFCTDDVKDHDNSQLPVGCNERQGEAQTSECKEFNGERLLVGGVKGKVLERDIDKVRAVRGDDQLTL